MKRTLLTLAVLLGLALPVAAQLATGNIYGTAADESGAPLPGVAVSVKGAAGTVNTISGSDGRFRVLNLSPGSYKVTATLTGFTTVNRENVVVATGTNVDISVGMKVASVEETITVTAETPVIDTKRTGTSTVFNQDELSKIPNSRDPWALLRTVPGVILDRVNVAGNESGQQSAYRAKGASGNDGVWALDGVAITDMAAIGASPTYFDYDAFQEIQISTSGNDIRQPTGGVGINFVTKRDRALRSRKPHWPGPQHNDAAHGCLLERQYDGRELGIQISLQQRVTEGRRGNSEFLRPVDDRKSLGDDQRLELSRGERWIFIHPRIKPQQGPEH
jgi:hypothetical protein